MKLLHFFTHFTELHRHINLISTWYKHWPLPTNYNGNICRLEEYNTIIHLTYATCVIESLSTNGTGNICCVIEPLPTNDNKMTTFAGLRNGRGPRQRDVTAGTMIIITVIIMSQQALSSSLSLLLSLLLSHSRHIVTIINDYHTSSSFSSSSSSTSSSTSGRHIVIVINDYHTSFHHHISSSFSSSSSSFDK